MPIQVFWIRLRCLVLRALAQAVNLVPKQVENNTKTDQSNTSLDETILAIEELIGEIENCTGSSEKVMLRKQSINKLN